ncbi:MAG: hypothetical protein KC503_17855 [Myxococcales bacterium]|nr:hypothetical protein [Myxococcales bacterium]
MSRRVALLVALALGALACAAVALSLSLRGPSTLRPGAPLRAASYIEARGTPNLRYLQRSSAGYYRFPLREHDAHLLVESDREPAAKAQRFRGSLSASLVGRLMRKDEGYYAGGYARQRKLDGTIYILRVSRMLSPTILTCAGGALLCVVVFVLLLLRRGKGGGGTTTARGA